MPNSHFVLAYRAQKEMYRFCRNVAFGDYKNERVGIQLIKDELRLRSNGNRRKREAMHIIAKSTK